MFYNARWYDPTLGRFVQADTVVPGESQGLQAWDRFGYANNNPVRYADPTGHCIDFVKCAVELATAATFLVQRAISNGRLVDRDFVDAADAAAPAIASGSKESATFVGGMFATWVYSKSLVTTHDGEVQVYNESDVNGGGMPEGGALPGIGGSLTHGYINGLVHASDYQGGATQANLSIPVGQGLGGLYFEGYKADTGSVWGLDTGLEVGVAPTILGAAHTNATPTNNMNGRIPQKLNGPGLLACRLASMCGAM